MPRTTAEVPDHQQTNPDQLIALLQQQMQQQQQQMQALLALAQSTRTPVASTKFTEFDPSSELWSDYWARFQTFTRANSIPDDRKAEIFLTNQSAIVYKMLKNLAEQQTPPNEVNSLSLDQLSSFMAEQYNPKRFVVRERYKFWTNTERKPGESVHDLAARIRQEAATCDFASIQDPLDEAMRTRFVCTVKNEAVVKALFKVKDDELTFSRAIDIAAETEEATKVAKETLACESTSVFQTKQGPHKKATKSFKPKPMQQRQPTPHQNRQKCYRCDGSHDAGKCRFANATCRHCNIKGHIEKACRKKKSQRVQVIQRVKWNEAKPILQECYLSGKKITFEVDTGSRDNFISEKVWQMLKRPKMSPARHQYRCASNEMLPVLGVIKVPTTANEDKASLTHAFTVTKMDLNLLGRDSIKSLNISVDNLLNNQVVHAVSSKTKVDLSLQKRCAEICNEFPELFKSEPGTLKDIQLEVRFKPDAQPVFCKPRTVPIAIQADLDTALQAGIKKGIWEPVQFNAYGTPVVPIKKKSTPGQTTPSIRVCGDYSVTVNPQLEPHRHPMPQPDDLMRKLGRGYGFSKIDLADAYNQICLGPESQKKLALSTHRGVLLQKRLPFGIISAPGYFQDIMDQLTQDLPGVAVYLDDILVSGDTAEDHAANLRGLLQRLQEKGLRCRREKCFFRSALRRVPRTLPFSRRYQEGTQGRCDQDDARPEKRFQS